jgi:hypothetical protein
MSLTIYRKVTLALNGTITMKKNGKTNPLTFDLNGYKISGRQSLSDFCNCFAVVSYDSQHVGIGSSVTGEFWSTTVELESSNKCIFSANPQSLNKQYEEWIIGGELGFQLTIEAYKNPFIPTVVPLPESVIQLGDEIGEKILQIFIDVIIALRIEG